MQKKITDFYMKYAEKNSITLPCAKAALADRHAVSITLEESRKLAQKIPMDTEFARLLDKAYIGRAISREEFLKMQLDLLSAELYNRYAKVTKTSLTCVFEDSYYKSLFDYQQFIGYGSSFNRISTHQIEAAVTAAWQGKNYSQRIWGTHRPTLARYLNRIVTTGFIEGSSGENMTAQLGKAMDMSAYEARRLIRTECSQVSSRANLLAYKENCTERFEFLAVLDYKTSERCRVIDGKIFNLSEAKIGINMPPLHPFCRSTTVPYLPDAELDHDDTRTARGADGESYKVPAKMKYREWHKAYVENYPAEVLTEKKYKHGSADAAQYDKYMKLLGHDAPKSFDEFQNIKYTGENDWRELKSDYRSEKYYSKHLTHDEKAAITGYVSGGSYQLNASLRDKTPLTEQSRLLMQGLDTALEKLPTYNGRVIRALVFDDSQKLKEFAKEHTIGNTVHYPAFTSASVLEGYHKEPTVQMNIISYTASNLQQYNAAECEILFRRGTSFKILGATLQGKTIIIEAEEVMK